MFIISASLASLTRETGPKVVKGDPARKAASESNKVTLVPSHYTPTPNISDSALKFTHILYNLSPAGNTSFTCLYDYQISNKMLNCLMIYMEQNFTSKPLSMRKDHS